MDAYIAHGFKKHPSLNGILVQKMLNASPAATIHTKIVAAEKVANTAMTSVNGLKSHTATLEAKK